jgi:hypothetical protein
VPEITPLLTVAGAVEGKPFQLKANEGKSFIGSYVLGMGFVLTPEEAQALIAKDPKNREVLFPYLNGEDLNSRWDQSASRWVINFHDWPLEKAEAYRDCMAIVREKVKPERDQLVGRNPIATRRGTRWWLFAGDAKNLYATIAGMERVLVRARIANRHAPVFIQNVYVFNEKTVVFANVPYTLAQSYVHEEWARVYSSTLRMDMQYTPSDCFETFPFPPTLAGLDASGERYHEHRRQIMEARKEGLTKTYNRFHDTKLMDADIARLRALHREMDEAVARAYGWTDLALEHGFHETKQGVRYTISEAARREVLARLLRLNHERYAEEVRLGLHESGRKRRGTKQTGSDGGQGALF